MEFYQLEAFAAVAVHRSFSRAAAHLYLSQPTVSSHVKSLELELGTPLFDRGKSDLLLTAAGESLYRYARDMLDMRTTALAEIHGQRGVVEEALTVAASSVPCQYLLPQAVSAFEKLYNGVSVTLRQENSHQVCEDIFRYHYPLGIVGEKYQIPRLVFAPLLEDELVVAIPRRDEYSNLLSKEFLRIEDLFGVKLLLREPGSGTRSRFEQELSKAGQNLEHLHPQVFDNQETIKQAVRQGLGITVISRFVVEDYEQFGILATRRLTGANLKREFCLVYHDRRVLSPASKVLLEHLKMFFQQEALK